jgi:hypothetical protein
MVDEKVFFLLMCNLFQNLFVLFQVRIGNQNYTRQDNIFYVWIERQLFCYLIYVFNFVLFLSCRHFHEIHCTNSSNRLYRHFQQIFSYIVTTGVISEENLVTVTTVSRLLLDANDTNHSTI